MVENDWRRPKMIIYGWIWKTVENDWKWLKMARNSWKLLRKCRKRLNKHPARQKNGWKGLNTAEYCQKCSKNSQKWSKMMRKLLNFGLKMAKTAVEICFKNIFTRIPHKKKWWFRVSMTKSNPKNIMRGVRYSGRKWRFS